MLKRIIWSNTRSKRIYYLTEVQKLILLGFYALGKLHTLVCDKKK